jgi:purine-binding chemotaxis protein CheW
MSTVLSEITTPTAVGQMVTFTVGREAYAVDVAQVQEIIRVPRLIEVPLAPPSLLGLANLRGQVLPLVSLRHLLGLDAREVDDTTRALVLNVGQLMGFIVDHVLSVIEVRPEDITSVDHMRTEIRRDWIPGVIQRPDGEVHLFLVLDFLQMIAHEFQTAFGNAPTSHEGGSSIQRGRDQRQEIERAGDEVELVSFDIAGQEYAMFIDHVREIMQMPDRVMQIPHAPPRVLGIVPLRRQLIPLISLRETLGFPPATDHMRARVMVISRGGDTVGLVTDSVREVLRVERSAIQPMPRLIAQRQEVAEIRGFCRLAEERLVGVMDTERLFDRLALEEVKTAMDAWDENQHQDERTDGDRVDDDEQFVVFRLGGEEYGVPIDSVQEIVRVPDRLTRVPHAPDYVEGVINLRGNVLPVLDFRRLLGLEPVARSERQRVMVFVMAGLTTGFIVDAVSEVLKLSPTLIEPAPYLSAAQHALLGRVANLSDARRMIQLINVDHLMTHDQIEDLKQLNAGTTIDA